MKLAIFMMAVIGLVAAGGEYSGEDPLDRLKALFMSNMESSEEDSSANPLMLLKQLLMNGGKMDSKQDKYAKNAEWKKQMKTVMREAKSRYGDELPYVRLPVPLALKAVHNAVGEEYQEKAMQWKAQGKSMYQIIQKVFEEVWVEKRFNCEGMDSPLRYMIEELWGSLSFVHKDMDEEDYLKWTMSTIYKVLGFQWMGEDADVPLKKIMEAVWKMKGYDDSDYIPADPVLMLTELAYLQLNLEDKEQDNEMVQLVMKIWETKGYWEQCPMVFTPRSLKLAMERVWRVQGFQDGGDNNPIKLIMMHVWKKFNFDDNKGKPDVKETLKVIMEHLWEEEGLKNAPSSDPVKQLAEKVWVKLGFPVDEDEYSREEMMKKMLMKLLSGGDW